MLDKDTVMRSKQPIFTFFRPAILAILRLEPIIVTVIAAALWFPSPARDQWLWLLLMYVPIPAARYAAYGRAFTRTPLDPLLAAFLTLSVINVYTAPFTRGLSLLARPLLGVIIYYAIAETGQVNDSFLISRSNSDNVKIRPDRSQPFFCFGPRGPELILAVVALFAFLVGILALGATQWNEKSDQMSWITDRVPRVTGFPGAEGGFNANEIAGALAWLTPLMAGAAVYQWRARRSSWASGAAFGLLFVALFLGQSRLAIMGVFAALAVIILLLIPRGRWKLVAWAALAFVIAVQFNLSFNPSERERLAERDEGSFIGRLRIWNSALSIIHDYPLTGVGLNMFRDRRVRALYPVPRYENRVLPHAHNELLQMGTDMGVPGMLVFIGMYMTAGFMTVCGWRKGDLFTRSLAVSAAAGLFAHLVFASGDAITHWDRFAFVGWLLFGVVGAQYIRATNRAEFKQS